jgi:solute:Na+ symporter, SSS family
VLSFGYWTTNFAEVQWALSARNMSASRRTPLIGAYPKIFLPAIIILPGLIAVLTVKGLGGTSVNLQYDTAIPHLIGNYLPEGMLGLAITGLLAAFMAGVAANVTAFNTVVTYDLIQSYFAKDRDSAFYLRDGRLVTIGGVLIWVATAFIAKGYSNIMNLHPDAVLDLQRAPVRDLHRRNDLAAGDRVGRLASLVAGTLAAYAVNRLAAYHTIFHFGSQLSASFWQTIIAFIVDAVVLVLVSLVTRPKRRRSCAGWFGG